MAFDRRNLLAGLHARAQQKIVENLVGLEKALRGGQSAPLAERAQRPWDLLAKAQQVGVIYDEEKSRSFREAPGGRAEDNRFDARRHARASERVTNVVGPSLAAVGGYGVEALGLGRYMAKNLLEPLFPDDPRFRTPSLAAGMSAMQMDLHNNAEGRRAAMENRPVRPEDLQKGASWNDRL